MFVRDPSRRWLQHVITVRGGVLPRVWRRVAFVTMVALLLTASKEYWEIYEFSLTTAPFVLVGLPLGIFLGFRNTASYDRFWEGRRLWGALVNDARTFARQALTLTKAGSARGAADPDERSHEAVAAWQREIVLRTIAYVHALRMHLRDLRSYEELTPLLPPGEVETLAAEQNVPVALLQRLGERVRDAWDAGWLHPMHVPLLEQQLKAFTDIQGGCERIKNTPIPYSYTVLIHQIVALYCASLPFGLVETIHWMTPIVVVFISYSFFGLDAVGDELEEPFGRDPNDLPLDALSTTIEINLRQRLGERSLPSPSKPVGGVVT